MIVIIEKLHKVKLSDCRQETTKKKVFPADVQDKVIELLPASNMFPESKKN